MSVFLTILLHELLLFRRNFGKIIANFLTSLISIMIFFLIAQNQAIESSKAFYFLAVIWFSLLFCLIFSAAEFLKKDFDDGTIEQILTSLENFEVFVLAKMLANWLGNCLPLLSVILPLGLGLGFDLKTALDFLMLIFVASLCINFICTFCGSLSIVGNAAPMIATIALPLIIPIMLIAFGGMIWQSQASLKILGGLAVFIAGFSVFATAKIVRIAAE